MLKSCVILSVFALLWQGGERASLKTSKTEWGQWKGGWTGSKQRWNSARRTAESEFNIPAVLRIFRLALTVGKSLAIVLKTKRQESLTRKSRPNCPNRWWKTRRRQKVKNSAGGKEAFRHTMRAQGWCRSPSDNTLTGFCLPWHAWRGRHLKEPKCIWTEGPRPRPKETGRVKKAEAKEAKVGARTQQTGGVMAGAGAGALGVSGSGTI